MTLSSTLLILSFQALSCEQQHLSSLAASHHDDGTTTEAPENCNANPHSDMHSKGKQWLHGRDVESNREPEAMQ